MKTGSWASSGMQEAKRVDFVLFVEAHHFLLHALFVVFVFLLDLLDLRLQRLQRPHPFQLFVGERDQQRAGDDGEGDDRHPPAEAGVVVEELRGRALAMSISGCEDVGGEGHHRVGLAVVVGGVDRAGAEREALGDGVEAAVAEGVAAQQAPGGEERARAATPKRSTDSTA